MWGALARQIAAYALTRRGKKMLAFVGTMLLCFVTAILLDLQMYISAGLSGVLAASAFIAWITQGYRQRREYERREIEYAIRREAAAKARGERIDYARSAVTGAAQTVKTRAADMVSGATQIAGDATRAVTRRLSGARDKALFWRKRREQGPPPSEL